MTDLIGKSGVKHALDGYQGSQAFNDALGAKVTALSAETARRTEATDPAPSNRVISRE